MSAALYINLECLRQCVCVWLSMCLLSTGCRQRAVVNELSSIGLSSMTRVAVVNPAVVNRCRQRLSSILGASTIAIVSTPVVSSSSLAVNVHVIVKL